MAKLTTKQRNKLPASAFADPEDRKYPMNDKAHADNALSRVSQFGSPDEKADVRAKAKKNFPDINVRAAKMAHKKGK